MAAGLLLGVSGCGKSAEAEKQAPASKAGMEKVLRVGGEATYPPFLLVSLDCARHEHGTENHPLCGWKINGYTNKKITIRFI